MNHHADKLPLDSSDSIPGNASELIEAYACPHCGTNAVRTVQAD
jgi:hypothetical protein